MPVTAACNSSLFYYSSVHAKVWYTVCYTGIQIQTRGDLNAPWVMFNGKCTTVIYGGNLSIRHKQSNEMSSSNHIQHNEHRGLVYKYIQIQTGEDLNRGGGVFLGILGGGMPPGSPSQDPIIFQTKKCKYSHPFSDLTSKKLCHHYFD